MEDFEKSTSTESFKKALPILLGWGVPVTLVSNGLFRLAFAGLPEPVWCCGVFHHVLWHGKLTSHSGMSKKYSRWMFLLGSDRVSCGIVTYGAELSYRG